MNPQQNLIGENIAASFGIELLHTRSEVSEVPPDQPANITIHNLQISGNEDKQIDEIIKAADEVNSLVSITRNTGERDEGILDIFTTQQINTMHQRITDYLGMSLDEHLKSLKAPIGYPYYVGRLATYFLAGNDDVTAQFGQFESRHTNPAHNAIGPRESNSREYANWGTNEILRQFKEFYQTDLMITLHGPMKPVEGSRISWERGIAECQFLVLDYVRDQITLTPRSTGDLSEITTMSVEDIEQNLINLKINRDRIVTEVMTLNPVLADQLDNSIDHLSSFMVEVFHRGKMGEPKYRKYPENARRAIGKVELLLVQAAILYGSTENQEEIPILDFE